MKRWLLVAALAVAALTFPAATPAGFSDGGDRPALATPAGFSDGGDGPSSCVGPTGGPKCAGTTCSFGRWVGPHQLATLCGLNYWVYAVYSTAYVSNCEVLVAFTPDGYTDRRCSNVSNLGVWDALPGNPSQFVVYNLTPWTIYIAGYAVS